MGRPGFCALRGLRQRAGFTMVELLAAIAVVGLLTATVCIGTTVAMKTYESNQFATQSQMLSGMVENSLSDPLRFLTYSENASKPSEPTYKLTYRNINLTDPQLVANDGRLYFEGTYEGKKQTVPLLNDGAYGSCDVSSASLQFTPSATDDTVVSKVEVTIGRNGKSSTFDYTFKSLGNDVTKETKASS